MLTKFTSAQKIQLAIFVFNDKHVFLTSLLLLNTMQTDEYAHSFSITNEPTFIIKKQKTGATNNKIYTRNGFAFDYLTKQFVKILHDSNEDTALNNKILNPVDTLPVTNKFSGDYGADDKNFISVRDGKNALSYIFLFILKKTAIAPGN